MARSFAGTPDKIVVDSAVVAPNWFTANYSLSVWVKGASGHGNTGVYSEGTSLNNTSFWWIGPDSTTTGSMRWTGANQPAAVITTATVFDNTPHHYCLSVGSSAYKIYVDGALDSSGIIGAANTGIGGSSPNEATIGALRRSGGTAGNFWVGTMWDLAVWTSTTLGAGDVKSLANGLPASHLGPTHYWPLWGRDSPEPDIGNG